MELGELGEIWEMEGGIGEICSNTIVVDPSYLYLSHT